MERRRRWHCAQLISAMCLLIFSSTVASVAANTPAADATTEFQSTQSTVAALEATIASLVDAQGASAHNVDTLPLPVLQLLQQVTDLKAHMQRLATQLDNAQATSVGNDRPLSNVSHGRALSGAASAGDVELAATSTAKRQLDVVLSGRGTSMVPTVTCATHPELCTAEYSNCEHLRGCSGHGLCNPVTRSCECDAGWGAASDAMAVRSPDCSLRACPSGAAWADIAQSPSVAHAPAECSRAGKCMRSTGQCMCFPGFTGSACEYKACPNKCSNRGSCVPLSQLHMYSNAAPFGPTGPAYSASNAAGFWGADKIQACVCDSSWAVGYAADETQAIEFFEPDCSKRMCPSGDDPWTRTVDETDCFLWDDNRVTWRGPVYLATGKPALVAQGAADLATAQAAYDWAGNGVDTDGDGIVWHQSVLPDVAAVGQKGNKCHIECARRGTCDYTTGTCSCFEGYGGVACTMRRIVVRPSK